MRKYPDRLVENNKGRTIIPPPPPGGVYRDWEKNCLLRKNAEINCLPKRYIWKKLSAETTYVMQDLGNLKKIVCTARVEEKNLQALNQWWKKFPASQKSRYPPPGGKIMVRP